MLSLAPALATSPTPAPGGLRTDAGAIETLELRIADERRHQITRRTS